VRQVHKKVANPEYENTSVIIRKVSGRLSSIEARRLLLAQEQAKLLSQDDELLNGLSTSVLSIGTALGIAFIGMMLINTVKDKEEKKRMMLITAIVAVSAAMLIAIASHAQIKDGRQKRKLKRLEKLKVESDGLELEYVNTTAELATYKAHLDGLPATISQTTDEMFSTTYSTPSLEVISLAELQRRQFQSIAIGDKYHTLIGEPERNFSMAVHGLPGNGKSTFVADLANDLAVHGSTVLYIAAEEGFSKSMQKKLGNFQSVNFFVSNCQNITTVKDALKRGQYDVIVIDSVQQIGIKSAQLSNLRASYPQSAFVYILQSTKAGAFKGDNRYAHDADIVIKLEKYNPVVEKTRFM
jgi:DNA replication protein DnaC